MRVQSTGGGLSGGGPRPNVSAKLSEAREERAWSAPKQNFRDCVFVSLTHLVARFVPPAGGRGDGGGRSESGEAEAGE